MLFLTLFSAYQVIHTWCEQNEPLKRSLNFFCGNQYFKHVIDGKVDMKLPERKNNFKRKNFGPCFSSLNCGLASVGVPLCYRMNFQGIGRLRKVTVYVFRQVQI